MVRYILVGVSQPGAFELRSGINRIGRDSCNDFAVADGSVSSFHCELELNEDGVVVRDLASTNGTFIDQQPVQQSALEPNQMLRIGRVDFKLEAEPINISIPERSRPEQPQASFLPDGAPACLNHSDIPAKFRCEHCEFTFCPECVRSLRLSGGRPLYFCTNCNGKCHPISGLKKAKPVSLFDRAFHGLKQLFGAR